MGFGAAITSFWKNFATFKARARRSEYWFIQLFLVLTNLAAFFIDLALLDGDLELALLEQRDAVGLDRVRGAARRVERASRALL